MYTMRNTGIVLYWQQFRAMFVKRVLHTWRNLLLIIVQLLIPIICTLFAIIASKIFPAPTDSLPLTMNLTTYGTETYASYSNYSTSPLIDQLTYQYDKQFDGTYTTVTDVQSNDTYNMLNYLVDKREELQSIFYRTDMVAATFTENVHLNKTRMEGVALFQAEPYHIPPMAINAFDNALIRHYVNESYMITTINHPLPRTIEEQASDQLNQGVATGFAIAFNMLFGMSFLASSFVVFIIKV